MKDKEIIADALAKHSDCSFGHIYNGMDWRFNMTRVVKLWRNEECYLNNDPEKYVVEGYPGYGKVG